MASKRDGTRSSTRRERVLGLITVLAVIAALREYSFNRNRERFGSPSV